ncbi:MAG: hypothetical protein OXL96_25940 [Candidatus Poribacteria bacterium]|nr:hypothetical protein [Candidatus Poribacteria bacterium]
MRLKKFRGFLCLFHVVLCAMVFNQQGFAGTWTDAFEDGNTQEWELFNTLDEEEAKWWIDRGEAVAETFEPHHDLPTVWSTGELDWRTYSLSCRAKLVKAKDKPASFGLILHQRWEASSFYICEIFYLSKTVYITKYTGRASTLGEFDFAAKLNRWYALTASIDSRGKLKFQIDDEVFTVTDKNPIKSGKAGLIVSGAQARFDDVKITGSNIPDGGPGTLSVEPSGKLASTWGKLKRQ